MLGQHFRGGKLTIIANASLGHYAATFAKQIRQDASVFHDCIFAGVGHREVGRHAIAMQGAGFNQPTNAKGFVVRGFAIGNLCGRVEKHQVAAKGVQHQHSRHAQHCQCCQN